MVIRSVFVNVECFSAFGLMQMSSYQIQESQLVCGPHGKMSHFSDHTQVFRDGSPDWGYLHSKLYTVSSGTLNLTHSLILLYNYVYKLHYCHVHS